MCYLSRKISNPRRKTKPKSKDMRANKMDNLEKHRKRRIVKRRTNKLELYQKPLMCSSKAKQRMRNEIKLDH